MNLQSYLFRLICLGFIHIKPSSEGPMYDKCVRCEDFNRQSLIPCSYSYQECGTCKPGFIEDEEDPRICYAIEILEDPRETITQISESDVYLPCMFNTKVHCVWERNGQHVAIGGHSRYQFNNKDTNDNRKVHDCSINIKSLRDNDAGRWQCSNADDSFTNSIKSKGSHISIVSGDPLIEINGENVTGSVIKIPYSDSSPRSKREASEHSNGIINCWAPNPTQLTWRLQDEIISSQINASNTKLNLSKIEDTDAKLDCIAKYSDGIEKISSVTLKRDNAYVTMRLLIASDDSDSQITESETKFKITKTFSYANNFIPKWVIPSMLTMVTMLIVLWLVFLVLMVTIYIAM